MAAIDVFAYLVQLGVGIALIWLSIWRGKTIKKPWTMVAKIALTFVIVLGSCVVVTTLMRVLSVVATAFQK